MADEYAGLYANDVLNARGKLMPGRTVTVKPTGSNTLATLYTDRERTDEAANPVTIDANGNLSFYADPGLYDLRVISGTTEGAPFTVAVFTDPDEDATEIERLEGLNASTLDALAPAGFTGSTVQALLNQLRTGARLNVGTSAGTLAAGDDHRFLGGAGSSVLPPKQIDGTTYTLEAEDVYFSLEFTNTAGCTIEMPKHSQAAIDVGSLIRWRQMGGQLFVVHDGPVVVTSPTGFWSAGQFSSGFFAKRFLNSWNLEGQWQEEANAMSLPVALGASVNQSASATTIVSPTVTPREGSLVVVAAVARGATIAPAQVTSTLQNVSAWTVLSAQSGTNAGVVVAYARCTGRQAPGTVTVTFANAVPGRVLQMFEIYGTHASTPVLQSTTAGTASVTPALTYTNAMAATSLSLAVLGVRDLAGLPTNVTEDADYTRLFQEASGGNPINVLDVSYDATTPDTTIAWNVGVSEHYGAVGLEIKPVGTAPTLIDPNDVPGLYDWLSGISAMWWASDSAWSAPADGALVSSVNNPFGADPAQATGANQPTMDAAVPLLNNQPALHFSGNQWLLAPISTAAPCTFVAVVAFEDVAGNQQRIMGGATATVRGFGTDGGLYALRFGSSSLSSITDVIPNNPNELHVDEGAHLFRVYFTSTAMTVFIDETEIVMLPTPAGLTSWSTWVTGAGYDGSSAGLFFRGWMALNGFIAGDAAADPNWSDFLDVIYETYDLRKRPATAHIGVTGQSLAYGPTEAGAPSAEWADVRAGMMDVPVRMAPAQNWPLSDGNTLESPRSSLVNAIVRQWTAAGDTESTCGSTLAAFSGRLYSDLKKGTLYYEGMMNVVSDADCVDNFTAMFILHGEADHAAGATAAQYYGYLQEWVDDYTTDILAATNQPNPPRFFCYQTKSRTNFTQPRTALAQLQAHENGLLTCALPLYWLPANDAVHVDALGTYYMGEILARAYKAVVDDDGVWEPLRPLSAVRVGTTVTVEFMVPVEPLVFDTTTVEAEDDMGFSWHDSTSSATITNVTLGGNGSSVILTLSGVPTGADPHVGYAYNWQSGNLRDSDPFVSDLDATPLPNWCVAFYQPVTT